MIDGRREVTLAATVARRFRWAAVLLASATVALFIVHWWFGAASLAVAGVAAIVWVALLLDGVRSAWTWRSTGLPALLTVAPALLVVPFAIFLFGRALYWANVGPSWWLLRQHRTAIDALVAGGTAPVPGVLGAERDGRRVGLLVHNGLLGAWRGIVHDPTGRLQDARGWNGGPVARDIRHLFGSETVWCQRLDDAYFHCHFD